MPKDADAATRGSAATAAAHSVRQARLGGGVLGRTARWVRNCSVVAQAAGGPRRPSPACELAHATPLFVATVRPWSQPPTRVKQKRARKNSDGTGNGGIDKQTGRAVRSPLRC